ncbi:MAG: LysM peptidoglycan-binding domain-containing M23 family metallopeptidase [Candidatus Omnitrophota bacterium]
MCAFIGCATVPSLKPNAQSIPPNIPGKYHRIEKSETLWKLSKMYNVDLDEIVKINKITDVTTIEIGQLIFIPARPAEALPTQKKTFSTDDFIWPLQGKTITLFGQSFNNMVNKGINIAPLRNQEVIASRSGKVVYCNDNFLSFGKTIIIDHADGFSTVYARNAEILVKTGDYVNRGAMIAKAGQAGRDKKIYLHFEIRKGHVPRNPVFYLPRYS